MMGRKTLVAAGRWRDDDTGAITEAPICLVCAHTACPRCKFTWCDEIVYTEDVDLCCDGECTYSDEDVRRFGLQQKGLEG